ncbi:MAG: polymerase sigma factor RpoE [Myxococcaceae bacterium]|jgi:RNA polymerase sigma-70 factor (ECF subfamily)|nr:polymerase sigma factor RpoE [Myxococcaceae bacterium]
MLADAAKPLPGVAPTGDTRVRDEQARLTAAVRQNYQFLWRSLRRLGLQAADVDDAAQQVLSVFARRLADVNVGAERSFLFQTALRIASEARRASARSVVRSDHEAVANMPDPAPNAEAQIERREARALLDEVLDAMAYELRVVFILFELEEMSTAQIAALLEIPAGTVGSRLHRAREEFGTMTVRVKARRAFSGGRP